MPIEAKAVPQLALAHFILIPTSGHRNCPILFCLSCPRGFKQHLGHCLSFLTGIIEDHRLIGG